MYLGIDIGSVSTDAVLIDEKKKIIGYSIVKSGFDHKAAIDSAIEIISTTTGIKREKIKCIVSTGYGRNNVKEKCKAITEISCHAQGTFYFYPRARTVIDIGGQDSKVIRINENGFAETFIMNDKCAAGTGRFLEVMAHAMGIEVENLGDLALQAKNEVSISSICTVFAESEVISRIAEGVPKEDIIAGLHKAIAERILGMARTVGIEHPVALSGGVAKNIGLVKIISKYIGDTLLIPNEPQIVGAVGAALFAMQNGK